MDPRLYNSAKSGNVCLLKKLVNENASLIRKVTPHENTALHVAAQFGHKNVVAEIYSRMRSLSLLTQPNLDGDTPLHVAARAGHFPVVDFLVMEILSSSWRDIESGRNSGIEILRLGNRGNNTILHEAVRNHHFRVVELLIKVDPELACFDNIANESPLYLAARDGMVEIVNLILMSAPSSAHGGSDGQTALHAAIVEGHNDIMEALLRVKPQLINESDHRGWTPLHYAASLGEHKTVRQLLEMETGTAYILDKDGQSPLVVAASKGHTNVVKEIIQYCPDSGELVDLSGRNALHVAVLNGKLNSAKRILETPELQSLINQADIEGNTPLHLATTIGRNTWIVHYLMWDERTDRRAENKSGQTATGHINESIREPRTTFPEISKFWRQLRFSRAMIIRDKIPTSAKQEDTMQTQKQMGQTLLMVDILIASVTFAAAFTMPGGYNNNADGPNQGLALLRSSKQLHFFIVSDSIAIACSIIAASILFWGSTIVKQSYVYYFGSATVLTCIALHSTAIAFATGVTAVMPDQPYVHTMFHMVGSAVQVSNIFLLILLVQLFSKSEVCKFLIYRLCKLKSKFINT